MVVGDRSIDLYAQPRMQDGLRQAEAFLRVALESVTGRELCGPYVDETAAQLARDATRDARMTLAQLTAGRECVIAS